MSYRMRSSFRELVRQMYIWGREAPKLYHDFRAHGMPRALADSLRMWGWLVKHAPGAVVSRPKRLHWCRQLAYRIGRLVGSVQQHVLYP